MERRESVEMVVVGSPMTLRGRVAEARREREWRAGDFSGRYAPEGRVRVLVERERRESGHDDLDTSREMA